MSEAPERIFIAPDAYDGAVWHVIDPDMTDKHDIEYIRKSALPVDEIREFVKLWRPALSAMDRSREHSSTCAADYSTTGMCNCERGLLRRILAVLEGEDE